MTLKHFSRLLAILAVMLLTLSLPVVIVSGLLPKYLLRGLLFGAVEEDYIGPAGMPASHSSQG